MSGYFSKFRHEGGATTDFVVVEQCAANTDRLGYRRICERYREFEIRISPQNSSGPVVKRSR